MRGLRSSDRAAGAIVLVAVWALGMEITPAIHLVGVHAHGGEAHTHGVALERDGDRGSDHGAGTLEHRGVAALTPAPAILTVDPAPIAELLALAAPIPVEGAPAAGLRSARAPPAPR